MCQSVGLLLRLLAVFVVAVSDQRVHADGTSELERSGERERHSDTAESLREDVQSSKARTAVGDAHDHAVDDIQHAHVAAEVHVESTADSLVEEGSENEEESEGEHEEFSNVDIAVALMLLGAISFVFALFNLVNMEDEDMRYYAWSVISKTISIFVAVLLFQALNLMMHKCLLDKSSTLVHACGDFFQMLAYLVLIQVVVALLSGVLEKDPYGKDKMSVDVNGKTVPLSLPQQKERRARRSRCYAHLLSHMAAFSAINFGGALQQSEFFKEQPLLIFGVAPCMYAGQLLIFLIFKIIRNSCIDSHHLATGQPKAKPRELSHNLAELELQGRTKEYALQKWNEDVHESENDITALCVSFLTVQACRFNISGVLPDSLGIESEHFLHSVDCTFKLLGITLFFAAATVCLVAVYNMFREFLERRSLLRMIVVLQNSAAMCFSWGLLCCSKWEIVRLVPALENPNTIVSRVSLALGNSFAAFVIILVLDKVADSEKTGKNADMAIFSIIGALGILVGFSWEQSFDGGVEVVASLTPYPVLAELALACLVAMIVIVPWRRYILHTVIVLEKERERKQELQDLEAIDKALESTMDERRCMFER